MILRNGAGLQKWWLDMMWLVVMLGKWSYFQIWPACNLTVMYCANKKEGLQLENVSFLQGGPPMNYK